MEARDEDGEMGRGRERGERERDCVGDEREARERDRECSVEEREAG